jgi:zinc/manganese transport system substrate-binding protein/manganese/iron transport system substrate-binding protein
LLLAAAVLVVVLITVIAIRIPTINTPSGIRVVTTTTVLADLVNNVGRGRVASVRSVVPAGVDVEDYNPAPADLRAVSEANLFIRNGRALDRWAAKLVEAAQPGMPTLTLSDGVIDDTSDNPHLWLDPRYAAAYALRIRDKLISLDPDGAATYESNTRAYTTQLEELDTWITQQVATIPEARRKLVTFHDAFPYFAARYGFELVGVITPSPGQEPSAGELAQLVQQVRAAQAPAVFSEAQFSPRLAQTLADEAGVTRVVSDLYNDSLGEPPADTYVGMMRFNVQRIVQALR